MHISERRIVAGVLLGSLLGLSQLAAAQNAATAPRPASQPQPPQPTNQAGVTVEGWATVRYSVLADGTTDNVRVLATVPPGIDTGPTIEAVEAWTFSPATSDGEAIDWHNTESLISYRSAGAPAAPSEAFQSQYEELGTLLESEEPNLQEAYELSQTMLSETATQTEELGLAMGQAAIIHAGMMDPHGAYDSIRLATDPRVSALSGPDLLIGLQLRMQLAVQVGRSEDALETYDRLTAELGPGEENPFAAAAEELQNARANGMVLEVVGFVGDSPWHISADRRIFSIAADEGAIAGIDLECDRRRATLEFQPDVEWQLPESWGDCEIFIDADQGTSFRFYELLPPEESG